MDFIATKIKFDEKEIECLSATATILFALAEEDIDIEYYYDNDIYTFFDIANIIDNIINKNKKIS